ncbi:MAG: T9SS type A sorting domain-containing protein, partial [Leeuwenhoekiella sp.]
TTFQLNAGAVMPSGNIVYTGASGVGSFFSQKLDLTVFSISNEGNVNWLHKFPQENFNTLGIDLALDIENNIYVSGVRQDNLMGTEELNVLKLNSEGEMDWSINYGQVDEGRRMNPYKIALTGTGDPIITSYGLYFVQGEPTNNRVSAIRLEGETGDLSWVYNSPQDLFYADSYVDGGDVTYLYCQKSFSTTHRITQGLTGGSLIKIGADGLQQDDEVNFVQEQEAFFFPKSIVPLDNGKLLLSGYINHENDFFSGLYFFEDSHMSLGVEENDISDYGQDLIESIYPNPASNEINVSLQLNQQERIGYNIVDLQGRVLLESKEEIYTSGANTIKIDLPQLSKGIYLCQLYSGTKSVSKKFIVR